MKSVFKIMQVARPGPNIGWIRKNAIEDSIELFHIILLWAGSLQKFTSLLVVTQSSKAYFTENTYDESYVGPYEGSNVGPNAMPNDDLKKNCDIIALMVKCVMVLS